MESTRQVRNLPDPIPHGAGLQPQTQIVMFEESQFPEVNLPIEQEPVPATSQADQCPSGPPDRGEDIPPQCPPDDGEGVPPQCPPDDGAHTCCPPAIPPDINTYDRLAAARYYHQVLGMAVHPLYAFNRGTEREKGKKPVNTGYPKHTAADVTPENLEEWFAPGSDNNVGVVVRSPYVEVDLDSKPDQGTAVQSWVAGQAQLECVPRERTTGGVHLLFICRDIPASVLEKGKPLVSQLNLAVSAELFCNGHNLVISPSVHKSGHAYHWEVTGVIPEVRWADLVNWFGFVVPEPKRRGRPAKEKPWWSKWREDLRTLDLVNVMREFGALGECVDADESKWSARCPWEDQHSGDSQDAGTDTVIFNKPGELPGYHCLHGHCNNRTIQDLLEWAEARRPGIIANNCTAMRVWEPGDRNSEGRPRIELPGTGRPHGVFALDIGNASAPALDLFRFGTSVVEIVEVQTATAEGAIPGHMFSTQTPTSLITAIERSVETGVTQQEDGGAKIFIPKSMTEHDARVTLTSRQFTDCLPRINRVLEVPTPIIDSNGEPIYPNPSYDDRFGTWLNPNAPQLRTMGLEEARGLLDELFAPPERGGFWWHDEQSRIHALARFVTPFCRGLMRWKHSPLWIFDGNREGCGKDTCADITHVLYTGRSIMCAPLSKDSDEEMRKRITSALRAGSRFFHLANMKGHIRYASLEAATDNSGVWEDRLLGVNETLTLPNETEYSFSANNATWEPDIERRCRRIRLRFMPDDINAHRYAHSDIRRWVLEHRSELLSAINTLIVEWVRAGRPTGPTPFTSFPEWGDVIGGIFHVCGLGDPCLRHEDSNSSGDQNTRAMRRFFAVAFDHFGDAEVSKPQFQDFIQQDPDVHDMFDWIDFTQRRGLITFGKLIVKFEGRELGGVTFHLRQTSRNCATYQFLRQGDEPPCDSPPPTGSDAPEQGCRDVEGCFHQPRIEGNKNRGDNNTHNELKGVHGRVGETSRNIPTSLPGVIHTSREGLGVVAADLTGAPDIALDIETYGPRPSDGLNPWRGDIRLLTLQRQGGTIHTIDLRATGYDLGPLKPILESADIIAHNAKFDLLWLRVKCGINSPNVRCTLTAARLLAAGTKPGNNLDQCLERYLGITPAADFSLSNWASMLLTNDQLAYAARDVAHLHDLLGVMATELERAGLGTVWAQESVLLPCVVGMEATGIRVDREKLVSIAAEAGLQAQQATNDLRAALGDPTINPASVKQVLSALRAAGLSLESTAEEALKAADDGRLIPLVLAHREAGKRSQQAKSLMKHIEADGRIHGRFEPTGTATGRFSSKEPNLQNIGRGEMREAFIAPEGSALVVADYSQVELRAAAAIAGETRMIEAYQAGVDLHRLTAATVLGKAEDQVTKADRQLAKAVNFGLLYGQSAGGLVRYAASSYGVTMTGDQAIEIRQTFFDTYSHINQWHGRSRQQAGAGVTEVRTRTGRRQLIPENANDWKRFTALVNTPVQGGTADGMKHALVLIDQRLPESAHIVSTVHDEVVVECPESTAEQCREIIRTAMVEAMAALFPEVPVIVEANICTTWAEK